MSQQAVLAFREKVNASRDLQTQIRAGAEAKNLDIVALGKAHGCEFAAEEVKSLLNESELSDFELQMVSGGGHKPSIRVPAPGRIGSVSRVTTGNPYVGPYGGGLNNATP